ncbi:MAG: hypothetical protein IJJ44_03395 [Solobacterium sp.]|nr:hypothetical protein [Solobacterium sp.]
MLLNDTQALEKAKLIIKNAGKPAIITEYFWIEDDEGPEGDVFCYYVKFDGSEDVTIPGVDFPLFTRNGEITDLALLPTV